MTPLMTVAPHPSPVDVASGLPRPLGLSPDPFGDRMGTRPLAGRLKRATDLAICLGVLLPASFVVAAAAFLLLCIDRHNPFFADPRVGRSGAMFRCWKLRTMKGSGEVFAQYLEDNPEEAERYRRSRKVSRDPRTTPLGSFLRKASIDEIPQVLNVLKGEMSIVGPRPLAPDEFSHRGPYRAALISVRPGITGLWQVRGRSDLSYRRRLVLDGFYVSRWDFALDFWILAATPAALLARKGAR